MDTKILPDNQLAFNVNQFLLAASISRSKFYELIKEGMIRTFTIGRSRYVSAEAARDFIRSREAAP